MASDTNNLVMHIRRLVRSSIRLAYHCACDHPEVLGAAIVLLLLHQLCPTLFAFMLSSSPVIVLTALLLGALLSDGEANVHLDGDQTLEENEFVPLKSNIYISDRLIREVQNVVVKAQLKKRTETDNGEVYVMERASANDLTELAWMVNQEIEQCICVELAWMVNQGASASSILRVLMLLFVLLRNLMDKN